MREEFVDISPVNVHLRWGPVVRLWEKVLGECGGVGVGQVDEHLQEAEDQYEKDKKERLFPFVGRSSTISSDSPMVNIFNSGDEEMRDEKKDDDDDDIRDKKKMQKLDEIVEYLKGKLGNFYDEKLRLETVYFEKKRKRVSDCI
jgi:hypothetical protein